MNFVDLFARGGVVMWLILACSVVGVAIFIDRLSCYRRLGHGEPVVALASRHVREGNFDEADRLLDLYSTSNVPGVHVLLEALSLREAGQDIVETTLQHTVAQQSALLSRSLPVLATLATLTPLLGLFGTVLGMIKAFFVVEAMGGRVNASVLAGGIWEAMLTTAFGLLVAIPLTIAHAYLDGRLAEIESSLEDLAVLCLKALRQPPPR